MPILTPAYPSMNSSFSVSQWSLEVMRLEMSLAHERVRAALSRGGEGWGEVFAPSDFFVAHRNYLAVEIYARRLPEHEHAEKLRAWSGLCQAKLRKLVEHLSPLPLAALRLMPKQLPLISAGADAQNGEGMAYVIGFDVDHNRMQGDELHLTNKVETFKAEVYDTAARSQLINEEVTHQQLRLKIIELASWRELPDAAFESLGGRDAAKARAKQMKAGRKAAAKRAHEEAAAAAEELWDGDEGAEPGMGDAVAGQKRAAPDGGDDAGASASDGASMPAKAARAGAGPADGGVGVPLQHEASLGELQLVGDMPNSKRAAAGPAPARPTSQIKLNLL